MKVIPALLGGTLLLGLGLGFAPADLSAQAVLGQALREGSGEPLEGAMVLILSPDGEQLGGSLTDSAGRFRVVLQAPGAFLVRLERIGFETVESGPYQADGTATVRVELIVPETAIQLEGIVAEADRQCVVRPGEGEATATLWDEVRKALSVTNLGTEEKFFRFEMISYRRDLNANSLAVVSEDRRRVTGVTDSPIRSLDAEDLADNGYVRPLADGSTDYFGPDAQVLLSDRFLGDHCWSIRGPSREENFGLVGLAFEPVNSKRVSDIEGVLWVEAATGRLDFLEYAFTDLPEGIRDERLGGRVDFEGLPNGAWIVRRWYIRMPQLGITTSDIPNQVTPRRSVVLRQILEEGAEVTAIEMMSGAGIRADASGGTLEGVVFDSLGALPLSGARVIVSGTQFSGVTDVKGQFLLEGIPDGTYTLAVVHADMIARKIPPVTMGVGISRGTTTMVELATPSRETMQDRYCDLAGGERASWPGASSDLSGSVRDLGTGGPMGGTRVRALWSGFNVSTTRVVESMEGYEAQTDPSGTFRFCGLPSDERITLQVFPEDGGDRPVLETAVVLRPSTWAGLDLKVGGEGQLALGPGLDLAPGITQTAEESDALLEARRQEILSGSTGAPVEVDPTADGTPAAATIEQLLRGVGGIRVSGNGFNLCVQPTRGRGSSGSQGGCAWPMVIVDGVQAANPVTILQSIPPGQVLSIRYLTLAEAGARYGTGSVNGALLITTR